MRISQSSIRFLSVFMLVVTMAYPTLATQKFSGEDLWNTYAESVPERADLSEPKNEVYRRYVVQAPDILAGYPGHYVTPQNVWLVRNVFLHTIVKQGYLEAHAAVSPDATDEDVAKTKIVLTGQQYFQSYLLGSVQLEYPLTEANQAKYDGGTLTIGELMKTQPYFFF